MNLSYWERETWFKNIDHLIIGSGIVGLNCALELRKNYPDVNGSYRMLLIPPRELS